MGILTHARLSSLKNLTSKVGIFAVMDRAILRTRGLRARARAQIMIRQESGTAEDVSGYKLLSLMTNLRPRQRHAKGRWLGRHSIHYVLVSYETQIILPWLT